MSGDRKILLDYPDCLNHNHSYKREAGGSLSEGEDVMMEAGVMPLLKGSHAFKGRQPLEAGKGKAWVFP